MSDSTALNKLQKFEKKRKELKEIKIEPSFIKNPNIRSKVGSISESEFPETIYITTTFWTKPKVEYLELDKDTLRRKLHAELSKIYTKILKPILLKEEIFPHEGDNIFLINIPSNFSYNTGRNFISIELYLHTSNINGKTEFILDNKKDKYLLYKAIGIVNLIGGSEILNQNGMFEIHRSSC